MPFSDVTFYSQRVDNRYKVEPTHLDMRIWTSTLRSGTTTKFSPTSVILHTLTQPERLTK